MCESIEVVSGQRLLKELAQALVLDLGVVADIAHLIYSGQIHGSLIKLFEQHILLKK